MWARARAAVAIQSRRRLLRPAMVSRVGVAAVATSLLIELRLNDGQRNEHVAGQGGGWLQAELSSRRLVRQDGGDLDLERRQDLLRLASTQERFPRDARRFGKAQSNPASFLGAELACQLLIQDNLRFIRFDRFRRTPEIASERGLAFGPELFGDG